MAAAIKTEVVDDKRTGRPVGLRIAGMAGAPRPGQSDEVFQVRQGDILISTNGHPTPSRAAAIRAAEGLEGATRVVVVLERRGKRLEVAIDPRDPRIRRQFNRFANLA